MIIILNGSVGTGKTSTMYALNAGFERAVALDGDAIGDVHPFEIYDTERISYLYKSIEHLVRFHMDHGYEHFVVNYVFESPDQLSDLSSRLQALGQEIHAFWLYCNEDCQAARIRRRATDQVDWELERFPILNGILAAAHLSGFIGIPIDNSHLSPEETAQEIRGIISRLRLEMPDKDADEDADEDVAGAVAVALDSVGPQQPTRLGRIPGIQSRLAGQLDFILEIDRIKQIFRKTRLFNGSRFENDAEHSWTVCCMAFVLREYTNKAIDLERVLKMLLVHDIVEIDAGDTFLYSPARSDAHLNEEKAAQRIFGLLEADQRDEMLKLWREFENRSSHEARFAAVLDRLEPLLQNYMTGGESWKKYSITNDMVLQKNQHISEGSEELWQLALSLIKESQRKGYFPKASEAGI